METHALGALFRTIGGCSRLTDPPGPRSAWGSETFGSLIQSGCGCARPIMPSARGPLWRHRLSISKDTVAAARQNVAGRLRTFPAVRLVVGQVSRGAVSEGGVGSLLC